MMKSYLLYQIVGIIYIELQFPCKLCFEVCWQLYENYQIKQYVQLFLLFLGALEDFKAPPKASSKVESSQKPNEAPKPTPPANLWTEDFIRQTANRYEHNIMSLFSPGQFVNQARNVYFLSAVITHFCFLLQVLMAHFLLNSQVKISKDLLRLLHMLLRERLHQTLNSQV